MKKYNVKTGKVNTNFTNVKTLNKKSYKTKWPVIVLIILGVIIFFLIILFAVRAYHHYVELENHRDYFKQPNAPIQSWMTIRSVVRHYNLSEEKIYSELNVSPGTLITELGIDNSTVVDRLTIDTICAKKHLNCTTVVDRLNGIGTNNGIGAR